MFTESLIQEWAGRVIWYAARRHYANGLLIQKSDLQLTQWHKTIFKKRLCGVFSSSLTDIERQEEGLLTLRKHSKGMSNAVLKYTTG